MPHAAGLLAACLLLLSVLPARAQDASSRSLGIPARWVQGYVRAVTGEEIGYPWAYAGQTRALLTRTTDGTRRIDWEGEPAPPAGADERVTYLWHGGLASGYGSHRFTLSVNGVRCATFRSGRDILDRTWRISGEGGCTLAFLATRIGTFNELFGLMMLTAPRRVMGQGPVRFSVVGEAGGSQDYYMTFKEPVRSWIRARPEQARFRDGRRSLRLDISHIGDPAPFVVRSGERTLASGTVETGHSLMPLPIDLVQPTLPVVIQIGGQDVLQETVRFPALRAWQIHLLPHSHVDIGYSDPQPEVERKQWKNLRAALALAARTAAFPPDARFKWNVEGVWPVESYLKQATPEERAAFVSAVKSGTIGMQANYTNILTGLCTPEELAHWTDAARHLEAQYGIGVARSAMHTDIPGLSWPVVAALARAGVRYFSSGPNYMPANPDRGDRIGWTLRELGDRPFWWVSPSGQDRLLFWMAGRGYSLFHGMNSGPISGTGRQTLLDYLGELADEAYPYDMVQVRYTVGGDNGPPDAELPGFVKTWNETYESPRLVIDTADALFEAFERRYGPALPTRAGDMTPYWEDGAISTAAEEALTRGAARRLQQAETLWALRAPARFPAALFAEAWRQVLLWHEHTWGAADSISQPDRSDVVGQWTYKRAFALEADRRSQGLLAAARPSVAAGSVFEIVNTLSWSRDGLVMLPAAATRGRDRAVDSRGPVLSSQRLPDGRLAVWVTGVPPLGSVRVAVSAGKPGPAPHPVGSTPFSIDNGRIKVRVDPKTGNISSLVASALPGADLADPNAGLNGYLGVAGLDPSSAQPHGAAAVSLPIQGPLVTTMRIASDAPGGARLIRRITLVAGADHVELETVLEKPTSRQKESGHLAFPFHVPGGIIRADLGEALVVIDRDQLPGSCKDFIGPHSIVDVSNDQFGVSLATLDAPLVEIGALTDERQVGGAPRAWRREAAAGTALYAYLFNNYWHTNYKADQAGRLVFRFAIWPHGRHDGAASRRFSAGVEQPLVAYPTAVRAVAAASPFVLEGPGVVVASMRPTDDGAAILVRLYNPTDIESGGRLRGATPAIRIRTFRSDLSGRALAPLDGPFRLPRYGSLLVRIETGRQAAAR